MQKTSLRRWQVLVGLFIILVLVTSSFVPAHASPAQLPNPPANQVAVKLEPSVSINTILARYYTTQIGFISETDLYLLQLPGGQTADQILPTLNADADIWYAEPNYYIETTPDSTGMGIRGTGMGIRGTGMGIRGTGEITPTPPGTTPWEWNKTGLADAQKISTGQAIIVAVLDTGLAGDHPLLQSNLTTGYDFVRMNGSFLDAGNGLDDDGDGLVDEYFGHGTHVAGIIVTYAPGVKIMPIRVLNSDGIGTYFEVSQGIYYAVDHGAKVINMSLTAPRLTSSLSGALAYAASHGVIVVAAAGNDDPGPNYPAGYSDPLAVIGVGASDPNDAKAPFSSGLAGDTDVFAPGVDIYSSYRYNGFGLGTGTSMAAPIVAAEAAMLIARHPDWSATEVTQRILTRGDPVSGSGAKRIDLADALSTGLEVDHGSPDLSASPTDEYLLPRLRLFNNTTQDIPFSELTLRYWYTVDAPHSQTFMCDYLSAFNQCPNSPNLGGLFWTIPGTSPNKTSLSDTYREVGFTGGAGPFAAGGQLEMYLRVFKTDMSNFNETNDYSYDPSRPDMARWERITVYRNGVLVWGVEPTGSSILTSTPTRTQTAPPVNTVTRTATAGGAVTVTRTATAPAYTATRTATAAASTPTRTNTPVAPPANTATRTFTPLAFTTTPTRTVPAPTNTPVAPTATASGGACSPVTSTITVPFTYDGAGVFCWQASSLGGYINSWNATSISVNGLNATNIYVGSGSYPAKIGGFYYVSYNSAVAWGHFEVRP